MNGQRKRLQMLMYIREYDTNDREACLKIFRSNLPLYFAPHELTEYERWLDAMCERKSGYGHSGGEIYYVIEDGGRIMACGGFYALKEKRQARMCWGMVDKSSHRKGYGTIHLQYRIRMISQLFPGYQIALDTSQHAFGFFKKSGFEISKITENAYAKGLHRYDMVFANDPTTTVRS